MEFSIEAAPGKLNLLHVRVSGCLTNGVPIVILRSDPPHVTQQKFRRHSQNPELLFTLYHWINYFLEGATGQVVFWPYRIEVQVEERHLREDFVEDLKLFLQLWDRDNDPDYVEEVFRVGRTFRPA